MQRELFARVPKFVLFTDEDRDIAQIHPLGDENLRANAPAPLRNILQVAEKHAPPMSRARERAADRSRDNGQEAGIEL